MKTIQHHCGFSAITVQCAKGLPDLLIYRSFLQHGTLWTRRLHQYSAYSVTVCIRTHGWNRPVTIRSCSGSTISN